MQAIFFTYGAPNSHASKKKIKNCKTILRLPSKYQVCLFTNGNRWLKLGHDYWGGEFIFYYIYCVQQILLLYCHINIFSSVLHFFQVHHTCLPTQIAVEWFVYTKCVPTFQNCTSAGTNSCKLFRTAPFDMFYNNFLCLMFKV